MGCPEIESTDRVEGIAPVPERVRLDPRKPGKIIAVPDLLKSNRWVSMGTKSMTWPAGETHPLLLVATNSGTSVSVDGVPQISSTYGGMGSHTSAGLFGRNTTNSLWDDFSITPP